MRDRKLRQKNPGCGLALDDSWQFPRSILIILCGCPQLCHELTTIRMKAANNRAGYYCTWMWAGPFLNFRCPLTGCGLAINWMLASDYLNVGWPLPVCGLAIIWNWPGHYLDLGWALPRSWMDITRVLDLS
jgi:hypothetical protein